MKIRYGTRGSKLALTQSGIAMSLVNKSNSEIELEEVLIKTLGDKVTDIPLFKVGGQGVFIKEIEQALINKEIDIAVHSLKDLPGELAKGLCLLTIGCEEDPRDCLISRSGLKIEELSSKCKIGTSSLRRRAQLLTIRNDLDFIDMRGNIDTRLKKLENGEADAIILAAAGLQRLGLDKKITEHFSVNTIIPAIGQGLLAIECREGDKDKLLPLFTGFTSEKAIIRAKTEREFMRILQAGCKTPVAAHAKIEKDYITIQAFYSDDQMKNSIKICCSGSINKPEELGKEAALEILEAININKAQI